MYMLNNFIGREGILDELGDALEDDCISIVGIIAPGGTGKTALVNVWLNSLQLDRYGIDFTYTWRFREVEKGKTTGSSHDFFIDIFKSKFGMSLDSFLSESKKAELLLEKLDKRRPVLILDEIESLQHTEGQSKKGKLFDVAIKGFLQKINETTQEEEGHNGRLIIVTSREHLVDLEDCPGYKEIELSNLTEIEGAKLLHKLGVIGTLKDRKKASVDFDHHALALVLLGKLIVLKFPDHFISHKDEINNEIKNIIISKLKAPRSKLNEALQDEKIHILGILYYYEKNIINEEERILLRMMALLHRPMNDAEREYLILNADFASHVRTLPTEKWTTCYNRLEKLGLLHIESDPILLLDCHPLIREHYRVLFKEESLDLWVQAQGVLFEYFSSLGETHQPKTLEDLIPPYRAVHHGCRANRYRESLEVYRNQIMQGDVMAFGTNQLGAVAEDTAALHTFFEPNTTDILIEVQNKLGIDKQAWLHARTAFCMTCLGRLPEAVEHREKEIKLCHIQENNGLGQHQRQELLQYTSNALGKLSELMLFVGDLSGAETNADKSIEKAKKSESLEEQRISKCRLAAVVHMKGDFNNAGRLFQDAVDLQERINPRKAILYSDHGFLYKRFILEQIDPNQRYRYQKFLQDEAQPSLNYDKDFKPHNPWLVAIGLDQLSIASTFARISEFNHAETGNADYFFEKSRNTLINSDAVVFFPEYFLEKARYLLRHHENHNDKALNEAKKALKCAQDYGMILYQADANLLKARIHLIKQEHQQAHSCFTAAENIINENQYWRRGDELERLRQDLK